jgi:hypothetical protein
VSFALGDVDASHRVDPVVHALVLLCRAADVDY